MNMDTGVGSLLLESVNIKIKALLKSSQTVVRGYTRQENLSQYSTHKKLKRLQAQLDLENSIQMNQIEINILLIT